MKWEGACPHAPPTRNEDKPDPCDMKRNEGTRRMNVSTLNYMAVSIAVFAVAGCVSSSYKLDVQKPKGNAQAKFFVRSVMKDVKPGESIKKSEWEAQQRESATFAEGAKKEGVYEALFASGDKNESMPLTVYYTRNQGKEEPGNSSMLCALTLGVIPGCFQTTETIDVTVRSPAGERTGVFKIVKDEWLGWLPIFVPYPTFDSDKRTKEVGYVPGDLVERGLARKTLELAKSLDCNAFFIKQKRLKELQDTADQTMLANVVQNDSDADIRNAADKRLEELVLMDVAVSNDIAWLADKMKLDSHFSVKSAAHEKWVLLMEAKIDGLDDMYALKAIASDDTDVSVAAKARSKIVDIKRAAIEKTSDVHALRKMVHDEAYEEIREAARNRYTTIVTTKIENINDIDGLYAFVDDQTSDLVADKAKSKIVALKKIAVSKCSDKDKLSEAARTESLAEVRDIIADRLAALRIDEIKAIHDAATLEQIANDTSESQVVRDAAVKIRNGLLREIEKKRMAQKIQRIKELYNERKYDEVIHLCDEENGASAGSRPKDVLCWCAIRKSAIVKKRQSTKIEGDLLAQRVKAILGLAKATSESEDGRTINFYGFFMGMSRHDAETLAKFYKLKADEYSFWSWGEQAVYKVELSLAAIRRITKAGNTFEELAQAVANRVGDLKVWENRDYDVIGYKYKTIDGAKLWLHERDGIEMSYSGFVTKQPIETAWAADERKLESALFEDTLICDMIVIPSNNYMMGKYEVTQEQWIHIMPYEEKFACGSRDFRRPVAASYRNCEKFINRLNALPKIKAAGLVFRFPTVNEWQFACRAGGTGKYCKLADGEEITEDALERVAWFSRDRYSREEKGTHSIGQKEPNAYGLHDMHGNISEWCGVPFTKKSAFSLKGEEEYAYTLGGSYFDGVDQCAVDYRWDGHSLHSHSIDFNNGLRLCCSVNSVDDEQDEETDK